MTPRSTTLALALATTALLAGACSTATTDSPTAAPATDPVLIGSPGTRPGTVKGGAPIARFAGFSAPMYADGANWLCGPGIATDDRCLTDDLDTTVIRADGSTTVTKSEPATNPAFDCFYVYPTVGFGGSGNDLAMAADTVSEDSVVLKQASRLREQCRVFAPLYRQMTFTTASDPAMAYDDVHNSFKHYMANENQGRPVLLIGHSQGSGMLARLMADEFDNDPELRSRLVSAMLLGGQTEVPAGHAAGGSFQNIPACSAPSQTGCAIGFNSVAPAASDGSDADRLRWGSATKAGMNRLCTNPGALGGGSAKLTPILFVPEGAPSFVKGQPAGSTKTPFVELPDAVTGACETKTVAKADGTTAPYTNLVLVPTAAPGDVRDLGASLTPSVGWGLHIQESSLVMRNLMDLIAAQAANVAP